MTTLTRSLFPFLPDDEWHNIRVLIFGLGVIGLLLSVTGALTHELFAQPNDTKYLATVVASSVLVLISTVRAPLRPLVFLAILLAPLSFVFTFAGLQPTPLIAVELVAVCVALPRRVQTRSAVLPMGGAFALLVLPAVVGSNDPGYYIVWLIVTLTTGWLTYLVAREEGGPDLVMLAITVVAVVEGALAVWEFKAGRQLNLYQASGSTTTASDYFFSYAGVFRPDGTLPEPIALGQVLCLCIPVVIAYSATRTRRLTALIVMAAAGVAALGLMLSLDRASLIGGIAGSLATLVLLPRGTRGRGFLGVVVVLGLVVLLADRDRADRGERAPGLDFPSNRRSCLDVAGRSTTTAVVVGCVGDREVAPHHRCRVWANHSVAPAIRSLCELSV